MAAIQVRARVSAFVDGVMRRPGDSFSIDEKGFNPEVFERVESAKAEKGEPKGEPKGKQPKAADGGASVL